MTATDEAFEANKKRAAELGMPEPVIRPGGLPAEELKPTSPEEAQFLEKVKQAQYRRISIRQQLADKAFHEFNGKQYVPRQLTAKEHEEVDLLRAEWMALKTKDAVKAAKLYNAIFKLQARYYLNMTDEEYYGCKFVEIKEVINALNDRTEYGSFL